MWKEVVNNKVMDEIWVYMGKFILNFFVMLGLIVDDVIGMFEKKENLGYDKLVGDVRDLVVGWL